MLKAPPGDCVERGQESVQGVLGVQELEERVVAHQHRHHAVVEDAGVEGAHAGAEEGRKPQDADP